MEPVAVGLLAGASGARLAAGKSLQHAVYMCRTGKYPKPDSIRNKSQLSLESV